MPGEGEKGESSILAPRILFQRPRLSDLTNEQKPSISVPLYESDVYAWESGSKCELFAAVLGNLEWLRFCLNSNRGAIATDSKGFSALHFAAQTCKLTCMQVLIEEYRFPVDLPTNSGQTALHLVIHRDNKLQALPCIRYLLRKGATLNCRMSNGSTPLHLAAREGLMSTVKVLVKNGADVHARDSRGYKAIDYCKLRNDRPCARFLKDAMWKQDKEDISSEKAKLKQLKDQLTLMELNFLTEYQKSHQIRIDEDYKKWLRRKLQLPEPAPAPRSHSSNMVVPSLAQLLPSMSARCTQRARWLLAQQEHSQEVGKHNLIQPQEVSKHNLTQPQVSKCNLTQPQVSKCNLTQLQVSKCNLIQPQVSKCNLIQPQEVSKHNLTQPQVSKRNLTQPQVSKCNLTQLQVSKCNLIQPQVSKCNLIQPQVSKCNLTQLQVSKHNLTQPQVSKHNLTQPQEVSMHNLTQPPVSKYNLTQPQEVSKHNLTQPQKVSKHNLTQPQEVSKHNLTQPQEVSKHNLTRPQEVSKHNLTRPQEVSKYNLTRPQEVSKHNLTRPQEVSKHNLTQPQEVSKHNLTRPQEINKHNLTQPQEINKHNLTQPQVSKQNLTQPQEVSKHNLTLHQDISKHNLTQPQEVSKDNLTQPQEAGKDNLTQPQVKLKKAWNFNTNPARSPVTQISRPQEIRLGLNPDPDPEHDLSCFLEVSIHKPGHAQLLTKTGQKVVPLPRLPFEVIFGTLCPSQQSCRMKVPEGLRPSSLSHVPGKRHRADAFWTDTLAMNLRETFEDAFVSTVRAHQGPPTLPSPLDPHKLTLGAT